MARTTWGPLTKEEQNSIPFTDPSPGGSIDGVTGTGLISMTAGVLDDPAVTLSDRVAADAANLRTQLGASAASGTSGKLSKFTGSSSLGDSILTESGTTVSVAGRIDFSLNTVPGLRLNNLTTAQRDATTPAAGALVWNTTTTRVNNYTGSAWTDGWVRLGGDTMTGPLVIGGGTVTANAPVLNLSQTWNNAAVSFVGANINVVNTASAITSYPFRIQVGGSDIMYVRRDGYLRLIGSSGIESTGNVIVGASLYLGNTADTILLRDGAANTIALRNAANAQTWNVYGTTDAGLLNYRRIRTTMTTGGAATIAAEGLGTGVSGNTLTLSANSTHPVTFNGTMIQIGGTTSSFPGLVASGASLQVRLADNSARASLEAAGLGLTSGLTFSDGGNVATGTSTGSKIGTGTTQKLGFWNATPIVQPSSTGETTGFTAGGGTGVTDSSTFTGNVGSTAYRISDIVKHLKNAGLIAS